MSKIDEVKAEFKELGFGNTGVAKGTEPMVYLEDWIDKIATQLYSQGKKDGVEEEREQAPYHIEDCNMKENSRVCVCGNCGYRSKIIDFYRGTGYCHYVLSKYDGNGGCPKCGSLEIYLINPLNQKQGNTKSNTNKD